LPEVENKLESLAQSLTQDAAASCRFRRFVADRRESPASSRRRDWPARRAVNNVGVLLDKPATTLEGLDHAFATNLLGPFELTRSLTARHGFTERACVINMSSGGMYAAALDIGALARQESYDGVIAYARQKRAQVALNAVWRAAAAGQRDIYVMHPGWVETPGVAQSLPNFRAWLRPLLRDVAAGADTALWLAATRPSQPTVEGIWFDRALRPVHVLPTSRGGDTAEALVVYLERSLDAVVQA
jgi:NAD(P)-dependent dehydrogenase (short-subunit alcohol dehydrogenase family)